MSRGLPLALLLGLALARPAAAASGETVFQEVVVRPGDTLWGISQKYLKDPANWDQILKYNRLPARDPTVALPGMTLRVPVRLIKADLRAAHLVYAVNRVLFRRKETAEFKSVKMQMELFRGDALRTLDDSKARVRMLDKELLSLEPNSMAIIKPADGEGDIVLRSGSVFAGHARIVTAAAEVVPKTAETRYAATVAPDLTTKVEVFKGVAQVGAQGRSVDVPEGMFTQVKPGLAPELPRKNENAPELEARAMEFEAAVLTGGLAAPLPRGVYARAPEGDATALIGDLNRLRNGISIIGYRVQASSNPEFAGKLALDKKYEPEARFNPSSEGLPAGNYWWRTALIDLLAVQGAWSSPRYLSVSAKRSSSVSGLLELKNNFTVYAPRENETINANDVRVMGVVRDDRLRVRVNGKPVRADAEGNFTAPVSLQPGSNEIDIVVEDDAGNQIRMSRRVTRP